MAEIAFIKIFKFILNIGYFGGGLFFFDLLADGEIMNNLPVPTPLQNIAAAMFIATMAVRTVWFVYDKFHLERKERNLKMDREREDINGLRIKNGQGGKN